MIQFNPINNDYVAPVDLDILDRSFNTLEQGHIKTVETAAAAKAQLAAFAQEFLNPEDYGYALALGDKIDSAVDSHMIAGNVAASIDDVQKIIGNIKVDPILLGKAQNQKEYTEFMTNLKERRGKDISDIDYDYYVENNPYIPTEYKVEQGRTVGTKQWKPNVDIMPSVDYGTIFNEAIKGLIPNEVSRNSFRYIDENGNITTDPMKAVGGEYLDATTNTVKSIPKTDIWNAVNARINSTPGLKQAIERNYDITEWDLKRNNDGKVPLNSDITDEKGLPLSIDEFIQKKFDPLVANAARQQVISHSTTGNGLKAYYNLTHYNTSDTDMIPVDTDGDGQYDTYVNKSVYGKVAGGASTPQMQVNPITGEMEFTTSNNGGGIVPSGTPSFIGSGSGSKGNKLTASQMMQQVQAYNDTNSSLYKMAPVVGAKATSDVSVNKINATKKSLTDLYKTITGRTLYIPESVSSNNLTIPALNNSNISDNDKFLIQQALDRYNDAKLEYNSLLNAYGEEGSETRDKANYIFRQNANGGLIPSKYGGTKYDDEQLEFWKNKVFKGGNKLVVTFNNTTIQQYVDDAFTKNGNAFDEYGIERKNNELIIPIESINYMNQIFDVIEQGNSEYFSTFQGFVNNNYVGLRDTQGFVHNILRSAGVNNKFTDILRGASTNGYTVKAYKNDKELGLTNKDTNYLKYIPKALQNTPIKRHIIRNNKLLDEINDLNEANGINPEAYTIQPVASQYPTANLQYRLQQYKQNPYLFKAPSDEDIKNATSVLANKIRSTSDNDLTIYGLDENSQYKEFSLEDRQEALNNIQDGNSTIEDIKYVISPVPDKNGNYDTPLYEINVKHKNGTDDYSMSKYLVRGVVSEENGENVTPKDYANAYISTNSLCNQVGHSKIVFNASSAPFLGDVTFTCVDVGNNLNSAQIESKCGNTVRQLDKETAILYQIILNNYINLKLNLKMFGTAVPNADNIINDFANMVSDIKRRPDGSQYDSKTIFSLIEKDIESISPKQ